MKEPPRLVSSEIEKGDKTMFPIVEYIVQAMTQLFQWWKNYIWEWLASIFFLSAMDGIGEIAKLEWLSIIPRICLPIIIGLPLFAVILVDHTSKVPEELSIPLAVAFLDVFLIVIGTFIIWCFRQNMIGIGVLVVALIVFMIQKRISQPKIRRKP